MHFVIAAAFQPPGHLAPLARTADEHGYEAMAFSDHVLYPEKLDTPYPYTPDGSRRYDETSPFPDPFVTIGALAAVTTRLRFTTSPGTAGRKPSQNSPTTYSSLRSPPMPRIRDPGCSRTTSRPRSSCASG